jgi:uncharacterized protein YqhQ
MSWLLKNIAKKIVSIILVIAVFFSCVPRSEAAIGCSASPASMLQIFMESITTLYNVFPYQWQVFQ